MMSDEITNNELMDFCVWFADWHGNTTPQSVFTTCLCGYFHTYTKVANKLLTRCKKLKLVTINDDGVTIVNNNINTKEILKHGF